MPIGDYCQRDVRTIGADETLRSAARRMAEEGVGSLIVLDGQRPCGVLTDRDVALRALWEGADPDTTPVVEALVGEPSLVHESSPLRAATAVMRRRGVRRLPVVDEHNHLVGVIAFDDLLRVVASELVGLAEAVEAQAPPGSSGRAGDAAPEVE
jgi:CBS domain-containing protein